MSYRISFTPAAEREFKKLSKEAQNRIAPRIDGLAANPRPHGSAKLEGQEGAYRIRVGDFRIIYEIQDSVLIILVVRIGNRRDVYR